MNLRRQLDKREQTIREMSNYISQLTNSETIQNSQDILANIFKSFQSFDKLTEANRELSRENQELREQVKGLYNRLIFVEGNLQ